jgi:hypothetical protein
MFFISTNNISLKDIIKKTVTYIWDYRCFIVLTLILLLIFQVITIVFMANYTFKLHFIFIHFKTILLQL